MYNYTDEKVETKCHTKVKLVTKFVARHFFSCVRVIFHVATYNCKKHLVRINKLETPVL